MSDDASELRRSPRARRVRRRFDAGAGGEGKHELLAFMLADEEYAVDLLRVREIIRWRVPTEVPRGPSFVEGVISLRGEIIPVLDVRKRLNLRCQPPAKSTRIVVVTRGGDPYGIIVDDVRQVVRILPSEVESTPPVLAGAGVEYVAGIWRPPAASKGSLGSAGEAGRMVILLQLDRVLAFEIARRGGVSDRAEVGGVAGLIDAVIGPGSPLERRR